MSHEPIIHFGDSRATFRIEQDGESFTFRVSVGDRQESVCLSRAQAEGVRGIVGAKDAEDAAASVGSEIERSFLVLPDASVPGQGGTHIRQGYLSRGEITVRVRTEAADRALLTLKRGSGAVRAELEFPIPAESAEALLELADGSIIEKVRHEIGPWELDVFGGALSPLVRLEVELATVREPLPAFPPGLRVVRELTGVPGTSNARMSALTPGEARAFVAELYRGA